MHAAANVSDPKMSNQSIWQPSPPCPTSCETVTYPRGEGRDAPAPNLLVHKILRVEKAKFCRVKLGTEPSQGLQGPSGATRGCQAAPVTCKPISVCGKASPRSLWRRVGEGPLVALKMSQGGRLPHWQQPGWSSAGLGKAELPLPRGPVFFPLLLGNLGKQSQGVKIIHTFVLKANYLMLSCSLCQNGTRIKAQLCYK